MKEMKSKKIIIYTCITSGYDELNPVYFNDEEISYVCFTDYTNIKSHGWEIRPLPVNFNSPALSNRYVKMHPHILFTESSISLYIDGNISIKRNIKNTIIEALNERAIALYQHPFRKSIAEECDACIEQGLVWAFQAQKQIKKYSALNNHDEKQLFECNIIFRKHHDEKVIATMINWWSEYKSGIKRDQISFPHVAAVCNLRINNLGTSEVRSSNDDFSIKAYHHRKLIDRIIIKIRRIANRFLFKINHGE